MNQSTVFVPKARELPEGFVYIDEWIEDCIIDAKYAGTDNIGLNKLLRSVNGTVNVAFRSKVHDICRVKIIENFFHCSKIRNVSFFK